MDISESVNLNTATENPLFDPTFLNLEYLFGLILQLFQNLFGWLFGGDLGAGFKAFLTFLCIFFIAVICYCSVRMLEIRKREHEHLHHEIHEYAHMMAEKAAKKGTLERPRNERWENVLNYLSSQNPSDWRLAVMESDAMLEELTETLPYDGENLGARLKAADREKFQTLDDAWEAHLVRNKIAHEGLKYDLTQREANRVVFLYENVLREFGVI